MFSGNSIADVYGLRTSLFKANDVADAIDASLGATGGGTTSGTSTAFNCSPSPAWTAYASGDVIMVVPHATCGANATLNVSGLGARGIRFLGYPTVGGELAAGVAALLRCDGTYWHLLNHGGGYATWTPTYGGSGSMTFTSVTTSLAVYQRFGRRVLFSLSASGTTGGSSDMGILAGLPIGGASTSTMTAYTFIPGSSAPLAGAARASGSTLTVWNGSGAAWTLGASREIGVTGHYWI